MRRRIDLPCPSEAGWVDRPERAASNRPATITRADGSAIAARVSNLSDVGCCIESDAKFEIAEHVRIAIVRTAEIPAQIRWTVGGRAGVRFRASTR